VIDGGGGAPRYGPQPSVSRPPPHRADWYDFYHKNSEDVVQDTITGQIAKASDKNEENWNPDPSIRFTQ
jgi:hypothetical protein